MKQWDDIRSGFQRPFWVANITEMFERLSYYAVFTVLAVYLHDTLHFSDEKAAGLTGTFGLVAWFLPIFGGAIVDKIGFRRALSAAYLILAIGYFIFGSIGAPWMAPIRNAVPLEALVLGVLVLPPIGMALVKPSVVGTTGAASSDSVRPVGYSIYYTMVNIGSFFGPLVANWLFYSKWPSSVFYMAAGSVFLMFFVVLFFFQDPHATVVEEPKTFGQIGRDFATVFANWRFVVFIVIFSGFWAVYWQQFLILPLYITHDVPGGAANSLWILSTDPFIVICFTVLISWLMRKVPSFRAVIIGTLVSSLAWLVIFMHASVLTAASSLVVLALGEIIQQPRYYEYISGLAPKGQQGQYMGFAFAPIGIGSFFAGKFGGALLHHYGEVLHQPQQMWPIVTAVGIVTTLLLWIYDRTIAPHKQLDEAKPATV